MGTPAATEARPTANRAGRVVTPADLQIAGLVPLSSCDWPGRLVATAFLQGCPWRCTYCHNPALLDPRRPGTVEWTQVTGLLHRRQGLLDGLVVSGGEPTRQAALLPAVQEVRAAGFAVGLHTAGAYPTRLAALLPYLDWVGLDIKASAAAYERVTGVASSARAAFAALTLVLEAGVDLQVRTTVDPALHTDEDVARLSTELARRGVRDHVLQEVRPAA